MKGFRYLPGVSTLRLDQKRCVGCGECVRVCPHGVFAISGKKACTVDPDACMECGACARNCPVQAVTVTPGVGCAEYIIRVWLQGKEKAACGGAGCC